MQVVPPVSGPGPSIRVRVDARESFRVIASYVLVGCMWKKKKSCYCGWRKV